STRSSEMRPAATAASHSGLPSVASDATGSWPRTPARSGRSQLSFDQALSTMDTRSPDPARRWCHSNAARILQHAPESAVHIEVEAPATVLQAARHVDPK